MGPEAPMGSRGVTRLLQPWGWVQSGALMLIAALMVTVVLGALDAFRWPGGPGMSVPPPVTVQKLLEQGSQERHSLYALLREQAPGARIVVDTSGEPPGIDRTYLLTLGRAGAVDELALPSGWQEALGPDARPDASGLLRSGGWSWFGASDLVDTVVIGASDGRTVLVDRRLVLELELAVWEGATIAPRPPSAIRAVVVETLLTLALVLLGGLVLPRDLAPGVARPPLALIAGVAVQAVTAFLFLAGRPAMVGGVILVTVIAQYLRGLGAEVGWRREDLHGLLVTGVVIAGTVLVVRIQGLVVVTADAVALISRSIGIADGTLTLADLDEKRPLAGSAVQAPAHALGIEGMHALSWVLLIAVAMVVASLPRLLAGAVDRPSRAATIVAALAAAAMLLSLLLRTIGALVSTHLMVGAFLLLLSVLWALDADRTHRSVAGPAVVLTLLALVPSRAESALYLGLILLGTLASTPTRRGHVGPGQPSRWFSGGEWAWPWSWPVVGGGLLVWNGLHVLAASSVGERPSFPVVLLTAVGALVLLAPSALRLASQRIRTALQLISIGVLWAAVVGRGVMDDRPPIFRGLQVNIGEGAGAWGAFGPIIAGAAVVAMVVAAIVRDGRLTVALWLTLGAFPSAVIAKAADGTNTAAFDDPVAALGSFLSASARVGSWGDSTNRMWVHFVPTALALVVMVVTAITARTTEASARRLSGARDLPVLVLGAVALITVLGVWRPAYLGPVAPASTLVLEDRTLDAVGPELTGTVRYERRVTVAPLDLPSDAFDRQVCVGYAFTDLGRTNWGLTMFGLSGPQGQARSDFGEMAWSGQREVTVCLPMEDLSESTQFTAWVAGGRDSLAGSSPAVRVDTTGDPVGSVAVTYVAPSEDPRSPLRQLGSCGIRALMRSGPAVVVLLLAAGSALIVSGRSQRTRHRLRC